jgi:hypothetical protein
MTTEDKSKPEPKKIDPIIATIAVAIIGFIATTIGSIVNNYNVNKLESRKFEFDLIKKGLEQPTEVERVKFLTFVSKLKLIKDYDMTNALDSVIESPDEVPYLMNSQTIPDIKPIGSDSIKINPDATEKDYRLGALKAARAEVGQIRDDNVTDGGPGIRKYLRGGDGHSWAIAFVSWCYAQNISHNSPFKYAYSGASLKSELTKKGWLVAKGSKCILRPGDIYIMDLASRGYHGGIVDSIINENEFIGIEGGNTSIVGSPGSIIIMVHTRNRKNESCSFGQIKQ